MRIQNCRWENCKWTAYIDQKLKTDLMMVMMEAKKIILMVLASTWEDVCVLMFSSQSCPALCETPWTIVCQALQRSVGFSRWEYWSELPFPSPGCLPDPATKSMCPALVGGLFTTEPPEKPAWEDSGSLRRNWKYEERGVTLEQELIQSASWTST